jgi:hypothetical protein
MARSPNNGAAFTTPPGCRCGERTHRMAAQPMVQGGSTERNRPCRRCGLEVEIREKNVRERSAKHCGMRISHDVCIGNRVPIDDDAKFLGLTA